MTGIVHADYIVSSAFDHQVVQAVAVAVSQVAVETGLARRQQKQGTAGTA